MVRSMGRQNVIKIRKTFLIVLTVVLFLFFTTINVEGNNVKTIRINETNLEVVVDPVSFNSSGISYENINNKVVLYTPNWPFLKTNRNEDAVEYVALKNENEEYIITTKNNDKNEIPLKGLIISIPTTITKDFNVGDIVFLNDISISTYKHAILSDKGVRIAFNSVNAISKYNSFTYYNFLYSDKTGTNSFSNNEMIVKFDKNSSVFKVTKVGVGANNDIPEDGFVFSANARPKTYMLNGGVLFNEGDIIELQDLEFIELENIITTNFTTINGTRFQDYLVVYPAASNPSLLTNQNIYGCEVAVNSDGLVVEKGVSVNIPKGGFALSGHGINEKFIKENIFLGSIVNYNTATKVVTVTNNFVNQTLYSYQVEADISNRRVSTAKNGMYDVNNLKRAETNLALVLDTVLEMEALKVQINNTKSPDDIGKFIKHQRIIEPLFEEIYYDTLVSRKIESRGTWHRPFEKNVSEIEATLDELKQLKFTDVYLETFWYGYTIYKSKYAPYHIIFDGADFGEYKDYLDAFINEAKKRNINVHAWVQNFYVGPTWYHSSLWEEHPVWQIIDINGSTVVTGKPEKDEENLLFLDPANPEVREFIKNIYKEIIEYDVIGLHLDYIRYPTGNEYPEYSTGYTEYATNEFKELYNVTGSVRTLVKEEPIIYAKWNEYRLAKITSFVEEINTIIRTSNKELILSMAVGPDAAYSKVNILQDWRLWVENGWIDSVEPMAYVKDVSLVISAVEKASEIVPKYAYLFPGIAPTYYRLPDIYNATYTDAINKNGAHGSTIFETDNFIGASNIHNVFSRGTYKNKSVSVQAPINEILEVFIEDTLYKFDNIYIKNGASTISKRNDLEIRLNKLTQRDYYNPIDFYELYQALDQLTLELVLYAEGAAIERFMEDINYFMEILDIRITRYLLNNGYWNLTEVKERPNVYNFTYPTIEKPKDKPSNNVGIIVGISTATLAIIGLGIFSGITIIKRKKR